MFIYIHETRIFVPFALSVNCAIKHMFRYSTGNVFLMFAVLLPVAFRIFADKGRSITGQLLRECFIIDFAVMCAES